MGRNRIRTDDIFQIDVNRIYVFRYLPFFSLLFYRHRQHHQLLSLLLPPKNPFNHILCVFAYIYPFGWHWNDRITFIADERFQSFYVENSGIWTLQIKYVQARDAGIYECQVSTEPKVSARVQLLVVGK